MKLAKTLLFPYLKRFSLMLLSVVLVGAFGCGILIGLRNAYHSLHANVTSLISECGYPDLYVETIDKIEESYISNLPKSYNPYMGIAKAEYRCTHTTTFTVDTSSYSCRLIGYNDKSILSHHLVEGSLDQGGARMDFYFAKANNFHVGDVVAAKMPDGSMVDYTIDALIVSPETSVVKADPYSISSSRDFAYLYVPKASINLHETKATFNQILYIFEDGKKMTLEETLEKLKEYIKQETGVTITEDDIKQLRKNVAYATTYDDSEAITFYHDALKSINFITLSAPGVFFVVVLIVTALFLFQIVRQCRKDIGIMRALGESTQSIALVFLSLGFVVGVLSWVLGLGIGSFFTYLANDAYGTGLKLFPQPFVLHPSAIFGSLGIMVTVTLLTAFFASLGIAKIKPVEAMKALPPSSGNTPFLTRTLFKKAPIPIKVTVSQTLRNLRRYLLSATCLLASGMLIFAALSIGESKNVMMNQLFETRINYDAQVYFDNLPNDSEIEEIFSITDTNITDKTLVKYLPSEMTNDRNGKKANGLINGIKANQELIRLVDDYHHVIPVPEQGIVLSTYHAYLLEAKVGDVITANDTKLTVTCISNEYLYQVSYTSFDAYEPEHARGSLFVKVKDLDAFFSKYKEANHVTYIAYTNVIKGEFNDRLVAFEISSRLLNVMAIVLGFMIVFNMMQTNLKEQKRTFATMRTLGYQRSSISRANLFASLFQYLLAMSLAIPAGIGITKTLLQTISIPSQIYPFPRTWMTYVLSSVIVLAFLLASHFLVMSSMRKWNLPAEVKERE